VPKGFYTYRVHEKPVPENGDCNATGARLDPHGKQGAKCNKDTLSDCEVGDLSGKYGVFFFEGQSDMHGLPLDREDPTIKVTDGADGVIGRSLVVKTTDGTFIACGNIKAG
ncbi:superoxide dismutase, partial [Syncephalis pseudoplumigaleata]